MPFRIFASSSRLSHYLLLTLTAGLLLATGNAELPLIDRDEPRFAEASREMWERSEWIIPHFNQEYRFDKPPLSYWLMQLGAILQGGHFSEFAVRLPAVLSAWLVGLMIYEMGRERFDRATGLWAGVAWFASAQVLIHGRLAVADMPLIAAITAATWAIWQLLSREDCPRTWQGVLYLSLAFGFLAKGPLAWFCPLLTVVLYRLLWRKPLPLRRLGLMPGLPLSLGLVGLWGIPAMVMTQGSFWHQGVGHHLVERGLTPLNGRGFTPLFYFVSSFFSLYPAIAWLGGTLRSLSRHWNAETAFLLAWLLGPYLIFSFYATQLSHYILPAFPAALLLLARTATSPETGDRWHRVVFAVVTGGGALLTLLLLLIGVGEDFAPEKLPLRHFVLALAAIAGGLTLTAWTAAQRKHGLVLAGLIMVATGFRAGSHSLHSLSPVAALAPVFQAMPEDTLFAAQGFEEPSLVYYAHRHWSMGIETAEDMEKFIAEAGPRVVLLQRGETRLDAWLARYLTFLRLPKPKPDTPSLKRWLTRLETPASGYRLIRQAGVNTARLSWVELDIWIKTQ